RYARLAAMAVLAILGCAGLARANASARPSTLASAGVAAEHFPASLGNYTLVRTWNESPFAGSIVYVWGQYAPADGGTPIAIGVSPVPDWHDPVLCHSVRGEDPLWQGQLSFATATPDPVNFSSAFYVDGVTQYMEATTICSGTMCGEFTTERTHLGFIYTRPNGTGLMSNRSEKALRILVRAETTDVSVSADVERQQLTKEMGAFLASVKLVELTRPYDN
ncbi:MAG: exosortase J, partial [Acidobacteriota bacterium]|nr:exosortase J [Acidobacteriota bacterium]